MRRIMCEECGSRFKLDDEDKAQGYKTRVAYIVHTKRPEDLVENQITITTDTETKVIQIPADEVLCDYCSENIYGQPAVAVTMWHRDQEEPPMWELGFTG